MDKYCPLCGEKYIRDKDIPPTTYGRYLYACKNGHVKYFDNIIENDKAKHNAE
jgi:hypothetical protein